MNEKLESEIIALTQKLLNSIAEGDWDEYCELCDPNLTAFEPEANGQLVHGTEFHKFYFDNLSHRFATNTTVASPHVWMIGDNVAVIAYNRLQQKMTSQGIAETVRSEETRVWHKTSDVWKHIHFHRSSS